MIYLHVPFCRTFCVYCGFYSEIPCAGRDDYGAYAKAVLREIGQRNLSAARQGPKTLYIGGGTPSVLPLSVLEDILHGLETAGVDTAFDEFTVEVNPDDVVRRGRPYIEGLLALGVNRISMGIQSFDDGILRWMNRRHDAAAAVRAYSLLREAGVHNISVDLIFGISHLSDGTWRRTIGRTLSLPGGRPEHISAYQLSVEEGSALMKMVEAGRYSEAAEDSCARQYDMLCSILKSEGYEHYEISNFALPGRRAVHNSAYWSGASYIGLGPAAHSYDAGSKVRSWNPESLEEYTGTEDFLQSAGKERLTGGQVLMEKIMLSLRTSDGILCSDLEEAVGPDTVDEMTANGNLQRQGSRLRIPEDRFFVSDSIISDVVRNLK